MHLFKPLAGLRLQPLKEEKKETHQAMEKLWKSKDWWPGRTQKETEKNSHYTHPISPVGFLDRAWVGGCVHGD